MLRDVFYALRVSLGMFGTSRKTCTACGFEGRFRAHGLPPRFDARCPRCGSLERHRLLLLADRNRPLIRTGSAVLHVAPEPILRDRLAPRCSSYVTLDLHESADVRAPLEATGLPDQSFDHVICCHVLEHVDDRRALVELHRILKPGGTLLAMIPLVEGWDTTYENASITRARDRELHFGQADHVRYYGRDVRARMRQAGFEVDEITAGGEDVVRYGLIRGEKLFVATRRQGG